MADAGAPVAIFRMGGVETDLQAKRLIFWLFGQEVDAPIAENLGFVPLCSVGLILEVGPATDSLTHVPHRSGGF